MQPHPADGVASWVDSEDASGRGPVSSCFAVPSLGSASWEISENAPSGEVASEEASGEAFSRRGSVEGSDGSSLEGSEVGSAEGSDGSSLEGSEVGSAEDSEVDSAEGSGLISLDGSLEGSVDRQFLGPARPSTRRAVHPLGWNWSGKFGVPVLALVWATARI